MAVSPPPVGLSQLTGTFFALHQAAYDKEGLPMVTPGFSGSSLSTGGLVNYVYEILFHLIDTFLRKPGDSLRQQLLAEALVKTRDAFVVQVAKISEAHSRYQSYLTHLRRGGSGETQKLGDARHVLTHWNNSMHPPRGVRLKDLIAKVNIAYDGLMKSMGKNSRFLFGGNTLVRHQDIFEKVARCQHMIDLEEHLGAPLPMAIFQKLCHRTFELDIEESDSLKQWVARVNGCWRVDVYKLHRGLKAMAEQLGLSTICKNGHPSELALLEYHLRARGVAALSRPDPHYLGWRRECERAKKVVINGREYELEHRLMESGRGADTHWIFPVRGYPDKVVVMGMNAAMLGVEVAEAAMQTHPIPVADVKIVAASGKSALVERLRTSVDEWDWVSTDGALSSQDGSVVQQVSRLIGALATLPQTPLFSEKDFRFTSDGDLKLQYPLVQGTKFELNRIIDLAYKAANNRLSVFTALLERSGLAKHPVMDFFQDIVEDALQPESRGVDRIAARSSHRLSDPPLIRQARILQHETTRLRDRCLSELTGRYTIPREIPMEKLRELLHAQIVRHYKQSIGAGKMWPTMSTYVVASLVKAHNIPSKR